MTNKIKSTEKKTKPVEKKPGKTENKKERIEKRKVGCPPTWASVEEFEQACEGFFEWCEVEESIPDIEGLAVYLDTTRKTILDYEKKEEFCYTIKKIKDKIAYYKKQSAMKGRIPSAVFCFDFKNNHGYVDKTEIEQNLTAQVTEVRRKIIKSNQTK